MIHQFHLLHTWRSVSYCLNKLWSSRVSLPPHFIGPNSYRASLDSRGRELELHLPWENGSFSGRCGISNQFSFYFFPNWRIIALQYCVVSARHQHESAMGIHMSPPSWAFFPPPTPSLPLGCPRAPVWAPWVIQQIPTGCFAYGSVCFHAAWNLER